MVVLIAFRLLTLMTKYELDTLTFYILHTLRETVRPKVIC